jgi:hypothetical protein
VQKLTTANSIDQSSYPRLFVMRCFVHSRRQTTIHEREAKTAHTAMVGTQSAAASTPASRSASIIASCSYTLSEVSLWYTSWMERYVAMAWELMEDADAAVTKSNKENAKSSGLSQTHLVSIYRRTAPSDS